MTLAYTYDGGAMAHDVEPLGINIPQRADMGEISMGGIPLEDPAASLTMLGHRPFLVTDSACAAQPRLFTGYVAERGIGRSLDRGMFVGADPRLHDLTIVDLNAIFGFRLISGVDGNRGAETWGVRLAWILGSDYLTGLISTSTAWIIASSLPMEPADYRQAFPSAVLADLSDRITKPTNYFAFWDSSASEVRLFFDYATETIGNCTKRISNVVGDIDSSTTFAPDLVASLAREPDQTYSEVIVNYANGSIFRQRPSTAATYIRRGTTISRPYTGSAATAQLQAELFLDAHAVEVDRITCSIQVPAASVGLIRAGQAIEVKFSHMPGYESFTWMRIVACSPKPTNDVANFYDVALELVGIPGEECVCLPGDDGTLGTGVVEQEGSWRELILGPIHVPAHCTMTIVRYDWSEYTNPGRPDLWMPCRIGARWQDADDNELSWDLYQTFGGNGYNVKVTLGADLGWTYDENRGGDGFNLDNTAGSVLYPEVGWALSGETIENASDDPFEMYLVCSNNPYFESVGTFEITATYICGDDPVDTQIDLGPIPATTTTHTTDPTVDDDSDAGYGVGHVWINTATGEAFVSVDSTNGAAVWVSTTAGGSAIEVLDEGISKTAALTSLDFVGGGVTATNTGGDVTVTIPGGSLPWFNVRDHGATGDGSTDDTTAVNAAIAALNASGKGVLYVPAGTYKCVSALTAISIPFLVLGDGMGDFNAGASVSTITCTSATASLFTITADIGRFEKICIANTAGSTPSAGAGVTITGSGYAGTQIDFEGVEVRKFWINVDVQVGNEWSMHACRFMGPVKYAVKIRNTVNGDSGDWSISQCIFIAGYHDADAAIRIESSGGGRISSIKVNEGGSVGSGRFVNGVDLVGGAGTSILLMTNSSFENYSGDGIHCSGSWDFQTFTGLEFGQYGNSTGHAISVSGTNSVIIDDITLRANSGTPTAIVISSVTRCAIGQLTNDGFATLISGTPDQDSTGGVGARVFVTGTPSAGQVPTATSGTAATWQAQAGGTPATTVTNETTWGIAPAVGSDTEYAKQDHTHGSPDEPAGTGELLITDTPAGSPLVFDDILQNEAGDDLLYSDV